jgi:hypothetical protein
LNTQFLFLFLDELKLYKPPKREYNPPIKIGTHSKKEQSPTSYNSIPLQLNKTATSKLQGNIIN